MKVSFIRYIKNYFLLKRYPFLVVAPFEKWDKYFSTWYDDIPKGWRKAFGKKMLKEIKQAGKKYLKKKKSDGNYYTWSDIICWEQIKEKYGELCLYASAIEEIRDVLDRYELMSQGYCIYCGKPARYITKGWIEFLCEKCFEKDCKRHKLSDTEIELLKSKHRLSENNMPSMSRYNYKTVKIKNFNKEEEANESLKKLNKNKKGNLVTYIKQKNNDGTYSILYQKMFEVQVDLKKEYGVDLKKLWGLE